jgi:hypothetical protein
MALYLEPMEEVMNLFAEVEKTIAKRGLHLPPLAISITDNENLNKALPGRRPIKLIGSGGFGRILNEMCPKCKECRLKTDETYYWCSGVKCNYIAKEETF